MCGGLGELVLELTEFSSEKITQTNDFLVNEKMLGSRHIFFFLGNKSYSYSVPVKVKVLT